MTYPSEQNPYDYTQGAQPQAQQPAQQEQYQQAQPVQGYPQAQYAAAQPPYAQLPYQQQPYAQPQSAEPITGGQKALYCVIMALIPLVGFIMLLVADTTAGPEGAYRAKAKWAAIGAIINIGLLIVWGIVSAAIGAGAGASAYHYYGI